MGDLRLVGALGLEVPSSRLLRKLGYVVDPVDPVDTDPPRPEPRPEALRPGGAAEVEVEATDAEVGGGKDGEAEKPSHEVEI
mmetsp:Transcript_1901/g.3324  ORF Transcript_1901/g.3324 Transcript_1901/m.3324 type:complete len:82 (-) Transcript_1901:67-312(-)